MNTTEAFLEQLYELNKEWFEANKHLTNEQMLAAGLIDDGDLVWINQLRGEALALAGYFETENQIAKILKQTGESFDE